MSATLLAQSAPAVATAPAPVAARRAGYALTGIAALFLAVDAGMKLFATKEAIEGTVALGWAPHHLPVLAAIQLACLALYLVPRTAPLGALLWTGYLGGAVATHVRLDAPLLSHELFPVYVAAFVWGGLWLRDDRVRALLPLRRPTHLTR